MLKNVQKIIVICLLVSTVFFIVMGIKSNKDEILLYSYTSSKKGDYQVLLKENDFYEEPILESGKYYASKSIDKYLLKFEYNFNSEKIENIDYRYNITAQLVGNVSNNEQGKEVWTKNYDLLDYKEEKIKQNKFSIKENIDINYDLYNNLAREYEDSYGISIDAILKVKFNIYYDIKFENSDIKNAEDYIELDIALTNSVSNVEKKYNEETKKEIFKENKNNINIYYVISIITGIISIALIINKKSPEEKYKRKIKYILKNYGELIVTVSNEPDIKNYTIMNINTFEDLIDLAEQNKTNIIHYEVIKDKQNKFYVFVDKFVYIYVVSID